MAASPADTRHARIALPKRNSSANAVVTPLGPTNMPHATSCGLDWPFTPKRREKKLAASAVREVTSSPFTLAQSGQQSPRGCHPGRGGACQGVECTFGIGGRTHVAAAAWTVLDRLGQVGERQHHVVGFDVGQSE